MLKSVAVCAAVLCAGVACGQRSAETPRADSASIAVKSAHGEKYDIVAADSTPAAVLGRYYAAINARRYEDAYKLWSQSGKASGKTEAEFEGGFARTEGVSFTLGDSVRTEGAAGSQFATIPVTVDATLRDGTHQHFAGTYTLRRSMVDGATAEQRAWRIYSANLE